MIKKEDIFEVVNKNGLHARPSQSFVRLANKFESQIFVKCEDEVADGKSILGMMMLAAGPGTKLKITAEGKDADKAVEQLGELINSGFNEE